MCVYTLKCRGLSVNEWFMVMEQTKWVLNYIRVLHVRDAKIGWHTSPRSLRLCEASIVFIVSVAHVPESSRIVMHSDVANQIVCIVVNALVLDTVYT